MYLMKKKNYKKNNLKILTWEGRAENIGQLDIFYDVFKYLNKNNLIFIFLVTIIILVLEKVYQSRLYKNSKKNFKELFELNTTFKKSYIYFNQWNLKFTPKLI